MDKSENLLAVEGKLSTEKELQYFKGVVRSLMGDAAKVLVRVKSLSHGAEIEEEIYLLDHYLDYTKRLCEGHDEEPDYK